MSRNSVSLRRALGVSRVARVTGLDRTGVEVACAIRPGGHVLQVTNGKGDSFAEASRGALAEAAELWASERVDARELRWVGRTAVRDGEDLWSGAGVAVPAAEVHCAPAGSPLLGAGAGRWTTNGLGAHRDRSSAALHGLLEATEREELRHAFPGGFTPRAVRTRLLDRGFVAAIAPRAAALASRVEARRFRVFFLDASARFDLVTAAALLFDGDEGPVPLAAGYACRTSPDDALRAALLEAAQSRLTDIHGARDDVVPMDRGDADALRRWCERSRGATRAGWRRRGASRSAAGAVRDVLLRLRRGGVRRAVAVDLGPPGFPLHVVRVMVPGFAVSELL